MKGIREGVRSEEWDGKGCLHSYEPHVTTLTHAHLEKVAP